MLEHQLYAMVQHLE